MPAFTCSAGRLTRSSYPGNEIPPRILHSPGVRIIDKHEHYVRASGASIARIIRKELTPIIDKKWNYVTDRHRNRLIERAIVNILKSHEIH